MNDTTLTVAGYRITLTGETRTFATIAIDSREYQGEIGNPAGKLSCNQWIDSDLLNGLYLLPEHEFAAVTEALAEAMQ